MLARTPTPTSARRGPRPGSGTEKPRPTSRVCWDCVHACGVGGPAVSGTAGGRGRPLLTQPSGVSEVTRGNHGPALWCGPSGPPGPPPPWPPPAAVPPSMLGLGGTSCRTGSRNSLHLPRRVPPAHGGPRSMAPAGRASSSAGLAPLPREASAFPIGWAQARPRGSRRSSSPPCPSLPLPSHWAQLTGWGGRRVLWQPVSRGPCPGHPGGAAGKAAAGEGAVMGQEGQAEEESGLGPLPFCFRQLRERGFFVTHAPATASAPPTPGHCQEGPLP